MDFSQQLDCSSPQNILTVRASRLLSNQPISLGFSVQAATPWLMIGAWSLLGVGCASMGESRSTAQRSANTNASAAPTTTTETQQFNDLGAPTQSSAPPRVVFSDEPTPTNEPMPNAVAAMQGPALADALASTYQSDMDALAAMQAQRDNARTTQANTNASAATDKTRAVEFTNTAENKAFANTQAAPVTAPSTTSASTTTPPVVPATTAPATTAAPTAPTTPTATATLPPTTTVASPALVPAAVSPVQANSSLELPAPEVVIPTDATELSRLLAASLMQAASTSTTPMKQWIAYAALAVTNPAMTLPADFGADLLPAERERVVKAHGAFVKLGQSLQSPTIEFDVLTQQALVAALSGGPRLSVPTVELCTRVDSFGRFNAIANRKFLAGTTPKFIVYSEVAGFTSALEESRFVTRLATRIVIETERDNVEVWRRSPEWTGSLDSSDVRRNEFFLGEIVQLSQHLTVGGYRLKVEVRDESTGAISSTAVSFQVVADPAMAAAE